jgi:hypothetical protein
VETKPGIYTTEFWITLFTVSSQFVNLFGLWDYMPNNASAILAAIIGGAYTVSRGIAKSHVQADPTAPGNFKLIPGRKDFRA